MWQLGTGGTGGEGERGKSLHEFLIIKYLLGFNVCGVGVHADTAAQATAELCFRALWCNPLGYFSCLLDLITASNAG